MASQAEPASKRWVTPQQRAQKNPTAGFFALSLLSQVGSTELQVHIPELRKAGSLGAAILSSLTLLHHQTRSSLTRSDGRRFGNHEREAAEHEMQDELQNPHQVGKK